jgi:hypothetical protein
MKSKTFKAGRLFVMAVLILSLAACTSPTPQTIVETQDPAQIVEKVVGTLNAQQTEQALLNPSATMPPTATPPPTQTPEPSATATLAFTATPEFTNTPEATATPTIAPLMAQVLYTTTYPGNKREYAGNQGFGLALGFQNIGSIVWEPGYNIKVVGFEGEITVQQDAVTTKTIAPGEKIEFALWAFGSETPGKHVWYFQLYTASGIAVPGGYASFSYVSNTPSD